MKRFLILAAVLMATFAQAADTAYAALRAYGKKEGEKSLYRVVELRGRNGSPQPTSWKLVVDAPEARGGIREVEVQNGRIVGQRTPVSREVGATMNFNQLNLDSDGAFTVVNQEAEKRRLPFDRLDYTLRSGSNGGAPIWQIDLFEQNARQGTMRIAADTGEVLERNFSPAPQRRYPEDHAYVENSNPPPPPPDRDHRPPEYREDREYREERRESSATLPGFLNRVGRHFQKRGKQLENFFTGNER